MQRNRRRRMVGKRERERERQVVDDVTRNRRAVGKERANSGKTDAPQIRPRISELESSVVEIKSNGSEYVEGEKKRDEGTGSVCTGRLRPERAVLYSDYPRSKAPHGRSEPREEKGKKKNTREREREGENVLSRALSGYKIKTAGRRNGS